MSASRDDTRNGFKSLKSPSLPSLTKNDNPIFKGLVSRQSQVHSSRLKMQSLHLHVISPTESSVVPLARLKSKVIRFDDRLSANPIIALASAMDFSLVRALVSLPSLPNRRAIQPSSFASFFRGELLL